MAINLERENQVEFWDGEAHKERGQELQQSYCKCCNPVKIES